MTLFQDLRYAVRTAWRDRAFSLIAVTTLALGIGANTALFTIVHAILLAPLPFRTPEQLVRVTADFNRQAVQGRRALGARAVRSAAVGRLRRDRRRLADQRQPDRDRRARTGRDRTGRSRLLHDARHRRAARTRVRRLRQAAGDHRGRRDQRRLWKRRFGGDPGVLGRRIRIDNDMYSIIGVAPAAFRHPGRGTRDRCRSVGAGRLGRVAVPAAADPPRAICCRARLGRLEAGRQRRRRAGSGSMRSAERLRQRVTRRLSRRRWLGAARDPAPRRSGRRRRGRRS